MKILIAVVSCRAHEAYRKVIRETWMPLVSKDVDVLFFMGEGAVSNSADEVVLPCDDSYAGLPSKVRAIVRWSLEHEYDFVLKCDNDVVLKPAKLLSSGFQSYDFVGHRNDIRQFPVPYGFAYWLSNKAMHLVADSELPKDGNDEVWVTRILSSVGIALHHDERYAIYSGRREDFFGYNQSRALRPRPPRLNRPYVPTPEDVFAYCIHITWVGYHKLPEDRAIEEFKKVFADSISKK